jgi:hypothetical protein
MAVHGIFTKFGLECDQWAGAALIELYCDCEISAMPRDFIMKGLAHVQVLRICLCGGLKMRSWYLTNWTRKIQLCNLMVEG